MGLGKPETLLVWLSFLAATWASCVRGCCLWGLVWGLMLGLALGVFGLVLGACSSDRIHAADATLPPAAANTSYEAQTQNGMAQTVWTSLSMVLLRTQLFGETGHVMLGTFRSASSAQGCFSNSCLAVPSNALDTDALPWLSLRSHSLWPVLSAFHGTSLLAGALFCHTLLSDLLVGLPISWTS